jgi:biotin carboxyl carrier protein
MIKRLRVTVDGNTYDVTVELPEDSTPSATPAPVITPPLPVTAAVAPSPLPPPPTPAPVAAPKQSGSGAPGDVLCPLAGRVTAVLIQEGQEVKEGEHLVTLEAMKMNTFVFAPRSGKVIVLKTQVGAVVEENQVLLTIN